MALGIPPLKFENLPESNPLKSRVFLSTLAVRHASVVHKLGICKLTQRGIRKVILPNGH